jgi:hypothetical protein
MSRFARKHPGHSANTGSSQHPEGSHRVGLFQNLDLAVNAEDVRHLFFEFGIAALQVVAYLVRLHGMCVENFAYGPLHQFRQAFVPDSRPIFARMASQEARRPQLVRIAKVLRFPTAQRHKPCFGLGCDRRHLAGPRTVTQRCQWAKGRGSLDATLHGLMMHAEQTSHSKEGRVISIGQKHARPLDPARWFCSRSRNRHQLRDVFVSNGQLDHKPRCCHDARPRSTNHQTKLNRIAANENLAHMIGFMESVY